MNENNNLLSNLIIISKIDTAIARVRAERKKLETELSATINEIKKNESEKAKIGKSVDEKRVRYTREEKRLRDERDKLIGRRKALTSLNNYKLQQSAEKEIEHTGRQLNEQEEVVIAMLVELEDLEKQLAKYNESVKTLRDSYQKLHGESQETFQRLNEKEQKYLQEREVVAKQIEPRSLSTYDRIKDKFVMDPVVEIINNSCVGCFMQIGPQVIVQIGRGDSLVRCPGCGRILYLPVEAEQQAQEG